MEGRQQKFIRLRLPTGIDGCPMKSLCRPIITVSVRGILVEYVDEADFRKILESFEELPRIEIDPEGIEEV